ncbi:hypothetical protein [Corynebacterium tapiri]|nr:hypothetical protein [Corynebacterium tapiri]
MLSSCVLYQPGALIVEESQFGALRRTRPHGDRPPVQEPKI